MTLLILAFGFLFGAILQSAGLNKYNTISGMARLEDFTVAKAIAVAVGVGAILLSVEIGLGYASFHVKPILLVGIIIGGLIFGAGMAILGYCPGTLPISLGEGSMDALVGIFGAIFGGVLYTIIQPFIQNSLGPDLGKHSLETALHGGTLYYILVVLFGLILIGMAFLLHKIERKKSYNWLYAGIGLAVLNCLVFLTVVFDRQIGASSTYPYVGDLLTGLTTNNYFTSLEKSGSWELEFLGGAMLSGLVISIIRKDFKIQLIHSGWSKTQGKSRLKRILWAFFGGCIMLIGARMAGGCTSGHVISGGMQIAASSLMFGACVFAGLLITGKYFYRKS
ncbi:MAG TPA: YeeE/YedE thiosulfate transporter family protein [Prolixibacteraceae bacterium]|nr:YeeE/YedE thiosulfate transporter family protein [Prolixibacteraceae bacterium]